MKRNYWLGVAAALTAMLPLPSQAAPVTIAPPDFRGSSFYTYAYGDGLSVLLTGPSTTSYSAYSIDPANHPASSSATLNIATNPFPSITASSSANGGTANVGGKLSYQFSIVGPDPFDPGNPIYIPTIVSYKGSASASNTNDTAATSSFLIVGNNFSESYQVTVGAAHVTTHEVDGFNQPFTDTSFDEHKLYSMVENAFYRIDVYVSAIAGPSAGTASAFIDPTLEIDPSFADAAKYHIVLSSGIGNSVAATPLPASLPLFGTALLGLAAFGYRGKRTMPAALAA